MNVIVIGDVMLDINYFSTISRNAPEANHIPVHKINNIEYILGGAANVDLTTLCLCLQVSNLKLFGLIA